MMTRRAFCCLAESTAASAVAPVASPSSTSKTILPSSTGAAPRMKLRTIFPQPLLFLRNHVVQFRARQRIFPLERLVENDDIRFGQRADGKFALPRMPDFADDEHVERPLQRARHLGGDDHAAARQSQHQVGLDALFKQVLAEPPPRIRLVMRIS